MAVGNSNDVAIQIEAMLAKAQPRFTDECCIYRVPHQIRNTNQDAYTPKVVSIGPLHHGNTELLNMEGHKEIYCLKFLERSGASLDNLVNCLQELEPEVRRCYSENIKLSKDELVKIILVDCGFIFELFLRHHFGSRTDAIFLTPWLRTNIQWDLVLLENQLPLFVFEKLYNLAFVSCFEGDFPSFWTLSLNYFDHDNFPYIGNLAHFTDLSRTCHLQLYDRQPSREAELFTHLYSATELHEAGVKFKVNKTTRSILDLQFSGHYLEIPKIMVGDTTELWLRNIVALEQCHYPDEPYFTDYAIFLDFLINTDKDVDLLVNNGIIINWLGDSSAVADMFNNLCMNVMQENFNTKYLRISKELNDYCTHPLHSKMATLRRDYFKTPWQTVASIAGIILLILTVVQTICSILQVV